MKRIKHMTPFIIGSVFVTLGFLFFVNSLHDPATSSRNLKNSESASYASIEKKAVKELGFYCGPGIDTQPSLIAAQHCQDFIIRVKKNSHLKIMLQELEKDVPFVYIHSDWHVGERLIGIKYSAPDEQVIQFINQILGLQLT